jgi:hypothetical protein
MSAGVTGRRPGNRRAFPRRRRESVALLPSPDGKFLLWCAPDDNSSSWRRGSSYRLLDVTNGKDRHDWKSRSLFGGPLARQS